jgi:8-oxo-dGTP diphosphatase
MKTFDQYRNPSLATDLVVFGYYENSLNVLLLNRKEEPFRNRWVLPGAFLQMDETFRQTCTRVLNTNYIHLMNQTAIRGEG